MGRFDSAIALAQRLILKNGRLVTYTQTGTTPSDPAQPWLGNTGDSMTANVPAVFLEFTKRDRELSIVQAGDKRCLIAAADLPGITPGVKDVIVDGSVNWHVVSIETLEPGLTTETIMYDLQVRV